jgi:hypothetical protein
MSLQQEGSLQDDWVFQMDIIVCEGNVNSCIFAFVFKNPLFKCSIYFKVKQSADKALRMNGFIFLT